MKKFSFLLTILLLSSSSLLQAMEYDDHENSRSSSKALENKDNNEEAEDPMVYLFRKNGKTDREILKEKASHWLFGKKWTEIKKQKLTLTELEEKYAILKEKKANTKKNEIQEEENEMLKDVTAYLKILEEDHLKTPNEASFLEILGIQEFLGALSEDSESQKKTKLKRQKSGMGLIALGRQQSNGKGEHEELNGSGCSKDKVSKEADSNLYEKIDLLKIDPNNTISKLRNGVKEIPENSFNNNLYKQDHNIEEELEILSNKFNSLALEQSIEEKERQNQKAIKELEIAERRKALIAKKKALTETIGLEKAQEQQEVVEKQRQLTKLEVRKQEIKSRKKELQEKLQGLKEKDKPETNP